MRHVHCVGGRVRQIPPPYRVGGETGYIVPLITGEGKTRRVWFFHFCIPRPSLVICSFILGLPHKRARSRREEPTFFLSSLRSPHLPHESDPSSDLQSPSGLRHTATLWSLASGPRICPPVSAAPCWRLLVTLESGEATPNPAFFPQSEPHCPIRAFPSPPITRSTKLKNTSFSLK